MDISIVKNGKEFRRAFIRKFTIPWDEFKEAHQDWTERCAAKYYPIIYEGCCAWELELVQPMKAASSRFCKVFGFE